MCRGPTKPCATPSLCSRAWEPQLLSHVPQLLLTLGLCSAKREATTMRSALQLESSPRSPKLEKSPPSTAKNKKF